MNLYTIFTDGSCYHKTRKGGIGVYIMHPCGKEEKIGMGFSDTTVSRMEMTAVIYALRKIPKDKKTEAIIYSDSEFICNSFNKGWIYNWLRKDLSGVKNPDLWLDMFDEIVIRDIELCIRHTRGHSKNPDTFVSEGNRIADRLADYKQYLK